MPEINVSLDASTNEIKAFTFNEFEVRLSLSTKDADPYWVESVFEVPQPLSLAPDKPLYTGKSPIGILEKQTVKEKRVKVWAGNDVYPNTYKIKVTLFIYDKDGAITERKEYFKELECSETNQVLQNP